MSEFGLGSRNALRAGAVMASAGALVLAGCKASAHETAKPAHHISYARVARLFKNRLGISPLGGINYYPNLKMSPNQLMEDLNSRTGELNVETFQPGRYSAGNLKPRATQHSYGDSLAGENVVGSWTIKVPAVDTIGPDILPIAELAEVPNGQLELTDQQPPRARQQKAVQANFNQLRREVLEPSSGLVDLAMREGALKKVEIGYDDDPMSVEKQFGPESSLYDEGTREEIIIIPKDQPMSYGEIYSTMVHETGHALFSRSPLSEMNKTPASIHSANDLRNACSDLKTLIFNETKNKWQELIPIYEKLKRAEPQSAQEIDYIISKIRAGELSSLQYNTADAGGDPNELEECTLTNPNAMIGFTRTLVLRDSPAKGSLSKTAMGITSELEDKFDDIYRSSQIMRTISEYGYEADQSAGHPEDGVDELSASLFDIALTHPAQFKANVARLEPKAGSVIAEAFHYIRRAFIAANPGLKDVIPNLFEK